MHELVGMYIDGTWRPAKNGATTALVNPATGEEFGRLSLASAADVDDALAAAQRGFARWRQIPSAERCRLLSLAGQLLRERVDAIGRDLTLEQGKTLAQARGEILATAEYFTGIAGAAANLFGRVSPTGSDGIRRSVTYEPIGPVFAVSPWNLPAMMPGRKIANSLGAGCSVIVKPARETPLSAYAIAKCCEEAGIPPGVVNVMCGDAAEISEAMIASPVIRKVSFTGSTPVGRALAQSAGTSLKKITLELGGHAPVIVFDDVNLEKWSRRRSWRASRTRGNRASLRLDSSFRSAATHSSWSSFLRGPPHCAWVRAWIRQRRWGPSPARGGCR